MKEPTFDSDGYPTEETLETIRKWKYEDGFKELLTFVCGSWKWGRVRSYARKKDRVRIYKFSTMGWSGNEKIIDALKGNTMFWFLCWQNSKRGGHYKFSV